MMTLQEYANRRIDPRHSPKLMTVVSAMTNHGWKLTASGKPICRCGAETEVHSFIGSPYLAECHQCGRFIADVTGPEFSNGGGCVWIADADKFSDFDSERCWISGRRTVFSNQRATKDT